MKVIKDEHLTILDQQMDNSCELVLEIRQTAVNQLIGQFEKIPNLNIQYLRTL